MEHFPPVTRTGVVLLPPCSLSLFVRTQSPSKVIFSLLDRKRTISSYLSPCPLCCSHTASLLFLEHTSHAPQQGLCTSCSLCQECICPDVPGADSFTSFRFLLPRHLLLEAFSDPPCNNCTHPLTLTISDTTHPAFFFCPIAPSTFQYTLYLLIYVEYCLCISLLPKR